MSEAASNDELISAVADQLAEAILDGGHDTDEETDDDPELWKPHPPNADCPICCIPLPHLAEHSMYFPCCGKRVCSACDSEHYRATNITNAKREKKELPPLPLSCPFCRVADWDTDEELIQRYQYRVEKGDALAVHIFAGKITSGQSGLPKDTLKALELWHQAAKLGCTDAFSELGRCYTYGDGIKKDEMKGMQCLKIATKKGSVLARHNLGNIFYEIGNDDLNIKHLRLAAAAGFDLSMDTLWGKFYKGRLSKDDLEDSLRAHKRASDEMSSEERERWLEWQKANKGDDDALKNIYKCYYAGMINANGLKKALKAHNSTSA